MEPIDPSLDAFRSYLHLLAELRIQGRLKAKVTPSDIVQETLLRAHAALPQFRRSSPQRMKAWLRAILEHQVSDAAKYFAREKRDAAKEVSIAAQADESAHALEIFLASSAASPSKRLIREEAILVLADAVCALEEDQRTAILLRHVEGRTVSEIAQSMGRSSASVAGLLRRGLAQLRGSLEPP